MFIPQLRPRCFLLCGFLKWGCPSLLFLFNVHFLRVRNNWEVITCQGHTLLSILKSIKWPFAALPMAASRCWDTVVTCGHWDSSIGAFLVETKKQIPQIWRMEVDQPIHQVMKTMQWLHLSPRSNTHSMSSGQNLWGCPLVEPSQVFPRRVMKQQRGFMILQWVGHKKCAACRWQVGKSSHVICANLSIWP